MSQAIARKPPEPIVPGFDYSALDVATASEAKALANRVRGFERRLTREAIDLGSQLIRMKERLPHGLFLPWLQDEFGDKIVRTAQRWMVTAEAFADKSDKLSYLPPSTLAELAASQTPPEVRNAIVSRIEAGDEPSSREILQEVKTARAEAKLTPEQRKKAVEQARRKKAADRAWESRREAEGRELAEKHQRAQAACEALVTLLMSKLTLEEAGEACRLQEITRSSWQADVFSRLREAVAMASRSS